MTATTFPEYAELDDKWDVKLSAGKFASKIQEGRGNQRLIFNQPFRDGTVEAEITIHEGTRVEEVGEVKEAAIAFRFQDRDNYYYAGIGGFGGLFYIAKLADDQGHPLKTVGRGISLQKNTPYKIQVRCAGNLITLSHNGIRQVSVLDNTFNSGPWGLHAWKTEAEFKNLLAQWIKPTCFVIMPFAPDFNNIYQVIRETVESHPYQCVRADERYLSGPIIEDVLDQIDRADLIIADFSGKNSNVFYEAGYARALRKPVIQIAQSVDDLPFDVRHLRTFAYSTRILGDRRLAHDISEAIGAITGFGAASKASNGSQS